MVSSFYDAYIFEQDGRLSEQIFGEYKHLNLTTIPRITSVPTKEEALKKISIHEYDLVITNDESRRGLYLTNFHPQLNNYPLIHQYSYF